MRLLGKGFLKVLTSEASEALPISDVVIHIQGSDEDRADFNRVILSDISGVAGPVELPSPELRYSLTSSASEKAYSSYNVDVTKQGYYTKRIFDVPIFDTETTTLPINMIAVAEFENQESNIKNLNTYISENEELE